jgi:hypothetical protein
MCETLLSAKWDKQSLVLNLKSIRPATQLRNRGAVATGSGWNGILGL